MHESIGADDLTAVDLPDALMAEADSQRGPAWPEAGYHIAADSGFVRRAGSRGNHYSLRIHLLDLIEGHLVIPVHGNLCPEFAKILYQVVGERIVVIDYEEHLYSIRARSMARIAAIALFTLS